MKIRVDSDKIIKALKKLEGIEVVLENLDDGKEALELILAKIGILGKPEYSLLQDFKVSSSQKYETSAVQYKLIFLVEFVFEEGASAEKKVSLIKELQEFFEKI